MKKFMSLLLSVLLILSLVPMTATATEKDWNSFIYYQDGAEFSFRATEFTGDSAGYKFYAAAYDADGKLVDVKSTTVTKTGDTLAARVNFEAVEARGAIAKEADTSIDYVKTMLWNGLTPVVRAGVFGDEEGDADTIKPVTVTDGVYSSLTNGFYKPVSLAQSRFAWWLENEGSLNAMGSGAAESNQYAIDRNPETKDDSAGAGTNRVTYASFSAASGVDRVVAYVYDNPSTAGLLPRQAGMEFYLLNSLWSGNDADAANAFWGKTVANAASDDVYYVGTSASDARFLTDDDAKHIYDIDEANGVYNNKTYQYLLAKKDAPSVGGPVYELAAYQKVNQQDVVDEYVAQTYEVAQNAAAFAYGSAEETAPYMAVDNNPATAWVSANTNDAYRDYLILDLGAPYSVNNMKLTLAEGSAQNFTVYGLNSSINASTSATEFANRVALTSKISTLTPGTEGTITNILSTDKFRYIVFEQDTDAAAFGFKEIEIYTTDAAGQTHEAIGAVAQSSASLAAMTVLSNSKDYPTNSLSNAGTSLTDADPGTSAGFGFTYGHNGNQYFATAMVDLGEAKNVSYVAYQGRTPNANYSASMKGFVLVGANALPELNKADYRTRVTENGATVQKLNTNIVDVLATFDGPAETLARAEYVSANDCTWDTGLLVFEVPEEFKAKQYRYIGVMKLEPTDGDTVNRFYIGSIQAYTEYVPTYEVAEDAAAFAYGSADGTSPAMAVDGDANTAWVSANAAAYRDYLILDLCTAYSVDSMKLTLAEGSAQNFTAYGLNSSINATTSATEFADRVALTDKISTLTPGTEGTIDGILSDAAFRYIVFEQDAEADTAFGFNEIKIYTKDAAAKTHQAVGVVEQSSATLAVMSQFTTANEYSGSIAASGTNLTDADPSTSSALEFTYGHNGNQYFATMMVDLGEAKNVSYVAWQGRTYNANYLTELMADFILVGSNSLPSEAAYRTTVDGEQVLQNVDVLARFDGTPTTVANVEYVNANNRKQETGLMVFEVPEAFKNNQYRYIGVMKLAPSGTSTAVRLSTGTIQAYVPVDAQ